MLALIWLLMRLLWIPGSCFFLQRIVYWRRGVKEDGVPSDASHRITHLVDVISIKLWEFWFQQKILHVSLPCATKEAKGYLSFPMQSWRHYYFNTKAFQQQPPIMSNIHSYVVWPTRYNRNSATQLAWLSHPFTFLDKDVIEYCRFREIPAPRSRHGGHGYTLQYKQQVCV